MMFRGRKPFAGPSDERGEEAATTPPAPGVLKLVDVHPGERAQVVRFSAGLSEERRLRLRAYGLLPGEWLLVLQHSPVTVVQIEDSELALERDLARLVEVRVG